MKIRLFGAQRLTAHQRSLIRKAARAGLGKSAARPGELCLILVSDAQIRKTNKAHLGHDRPTDVIAFPYPEPAPGIIDASPPFGDIYIARGTARCQAKELGHDLLTELMTLAVHGTLHLVGYDDIKPADRRKMFARQDAIMRSLRPGSHS